MSSPCMQKIHKKEIFPGVIEYKSRHCKHFAWQFCEENYLKMVPTCVFGTQNITEVSGIPIQPPLKDHELVVKRPDECPIGIKDENELFVFTQGEMVEVIENDKTRQVTLEVFV